MITHKEVKDRYKAMLTAKLKGRRKKGSYVMLDWPGCINSGADVKLIYWGPKEWEVRYWARLLAKQPALKKEARIVTGKYGEKLALFRCTTKGRAIQKMLTVAKGIIDSTVKTENEKERYRKAMADGDHETAFDALMELR